MASSHSTPKPRIDLLGKQCGLWTVIAYDAERSRPRGQTYWRCRCVCGTIRSVLRSSLTRGGNPGCGCTRRKGPLPAKQTPEHRSWLSMKARCYYPGDRYYHRYGGRGITVCDAWRNSFRQFLADMGPRPSPKHQVERRDNDGPYSPENCLWATPKEQARNRHNTCRLTFRGRTQTLSEWSEELGISINALHLRLYYGWTLERTLTTPARKVTRHRQMRQEGAGNEEAIDSTSGHGR